MTESKSSDETTKKSMSEERGPNLVERGKEEIEAILHHQKKSSSPPHKRETHGLNSDIDENTSLDDVKAPNVFERAKEEFQALAQVFHHKKEASSHVIRDENQMESKHKQEITSSPSGSETKSKASSNVFVRAKEEIKAAIHHDKSKHHHHHHHHHHKETHGQNDDIDESTPINEVKGPNVFERVKEEFEAVFQAIHRKKER